jgi:hypothetical protein
MILIKGQNLTPELIKHKDLVTKRKRSWFKRWKEISLHLDQLEANNIFHQ